MINLKEFFAEDSDYYKIFSAEQKKIKDNYLLVLNLINYLDREYKDRELDGLVTNLYERIRDELATTDI